MADRELIERLLFLAETAVDQALDLDYDDPEDYFIYRELRELKAAALAQPGPQGPTDEDLYDLADVFNGDPVPAMRRALELWGRPAIEPVPVSERLPGPEDCDAEGRCWLHGPHLLGDEAAWVYGYPAWAQRFTDVYSHWLPHWALPVPKREGEQ